MGVSLGPAGGVRRDAKDLVDAYELGRDEARAVAAALALVDLGERAAGSVLDGLRGNGVGLGSATTSKG